MNGKKCGSAVLTALQIKQIPIGEYTSIIRKRGIHAFLRGANFTNWIDTLWHNAGIVMALDIVMRVKARKGEK